MTATVIGILRSADDHRAAIEEIDPLIELDPELGTPEADRLELLALLVEDYEDKNFLIAPPDPIEALEFRMDQQGIKQKDLVPMIGSKSKVSEVLAGKRPLSISMVRSLSEGLGIPTEVLLQESVTPVERRKQTVSVTERSGDPKQLYRAALILGSSSEQSKIMIVYNWNMEKAVQAMFEAKVPGSVTNMTHSKRRYVRRTAIKARESISEPA